MKNLSKLRETIEKIKSEKNFNLEIIEKLKFDLDEEEKISKNYLKLL